MTPLIGSRLASLAIGALAGLVLWVAFPPIGLAVAAPLSVGLLVAALWGASVRRGLAVGLVSGLTCYLPLLHWMSVVGADAWLLLAAYCAAWVALAGGGIALVSRLPGAPLWIAAVWVLQESLRGRIPFGGFPWGELAFTQADSPMAALAWLGGVPFVSFVVALVGASLVRAVVALRAGARPTAAGWTAAAVVCVVAGIVVPTTTSGDDVGGPASTTLAIVQGGTPQFGMGALDVRRAVLDNHVRQTLDLAAAVDAGTTQQPDLVLWPENSSDLDPFADPSVAAEISAAARAIGVPIVVGAVVAADDPRGVWNMSIVWDPVEGPTQTYIKRHPVPFGEYIPFRSVLEQYTDRFDRIPRDFLPGDRPGVLVIGDVDMGIVICFEIAYQDVVADVVRGGGRLIAVQTNNATYGETGQPEQQLAITRMRAIEFGRTTAVAATSGISAVVDASGTVVQRMDVGEEGWFVREVPLRGTMTPAGIVGGWVELLIGLAALGGIGWALASRRRARSIA